MRRPPGPRRQNRRHRRPLQIEPLERRCVPATITPTTFADGGLGTGSLRDAVLQLNADSSTADDTIQLQAGTYTLTIRNGHGHENTGLEGDLNLTQTSHHWVIQGAGSSTMIDASQLQDRVFDIVTPGTQVAFRDLVICGGLARDNGTEGALPGTTDALGGGILNNGGTVTLDHVVLQNNLARGGDVTALRAAGHSALGGGLYSTGGALTVAGATIANNQASGGRGGNSSRTFFPAGAGGSAGGAGLYAAGGSLDISDSRITNNQATGARGGDGAVYYTTSHTTSGGITYNSHRLGGQGGKGLGGGLYVNGGSLTVASSTIASNQETAGPGGVNGSAGGSEGGGLYILSNAGTPTVTGSILSGNSGGDGGGIYNGGTLTVSNSTLAGSSAQYEGGGIGNPYRATLTVRNSTLSGNLALDGGGIWSSGTLTVNNSTLSGSSATTAGGGIYNYNGTLTVSDSTLCGNTGDAGGGIYTERGPVTLTNGTLTANRAGAPGNLHGGGGLDVADSLHSPVLHNTLIAGNFNGATTRDDVAGHLDAGGDYNLTGDGTDMTGLRNGVNGNQVGRASAPIDPLLDLLDNYGGPTRTHALLAGSPALNAGDPNQLGTADQRGVVRRGGVNIGAYQASATAFVLTTPGTVQAGVPFDVTAAAVDIFGQVAVGYTGTVTFSTTDPDSGVVLPPDYTFRRADGGVHTFTDTGLGEITLVSVGGQVLTVTDAADMTLTGSATVAVEPGGPAPAPTGSPRPVGAGTAGAITPVQDAKPRAASAGERSFAALADEESVSLWLWWEHWEPGDPAGWLWVLWPEAQGPFV